MKEFKPTKAKLDKDLLILQRRTKAVAGEIVSSGQRITALKLGPNVYVTNETVPHSLKIVANFQQSDIHSVKSPSDYGYFLARWRAFEGSGGAHGSTQ